ncbi:MAG: hypothetical protein ABDH66_07695 [Bacteroidia bacterium]
MAPHSSGKKKRTLVVIDGDALREGAKYDFSFLENHKRLEIWFFYKDKVNHSFKLRRDFSAKNVLLPRYEDDLHLYILKRVCYELGRREGRYRRAIFVGSHHPIWEGLVQFLRERGLNCTHILAEDYREPSAASMSSSPMESENMISPELSLTGPPATESSSSRLVSPEKKEASSSILQSPPSGEIKLSDEDLARLFKRKGRATTKHIQVYARILNAIRSLPQPSLSISELRQMIQKMGISIKNDLPGSNMTYFLHRLAEAGFIRVEGKQIIIPSET